MPKKAKAIVGQIECNVAKSKQNVAKMQPHHLEIYDALAQGLQPKAIMAKLGCTRAQIRYVRERFDPAPATAQANDIATNSARYDKEIASIYKDIAIRVGNTIKDADIKRMSVAQRVTTMAVCTDKSRLIEGKSTENQAVQIMHNINPQQLEIIQEMAKRLKKSMLSG